MKRTLMILLTVWSLTAALTAGCSPGQSSETPPDKQSDQHQQLAAKVEQLEAERNELKRQVDILTKQVDRLNQEKEIRNLVDLQARKVIAAMLAKDSAAITELVTKDVEVGEEKLIFDYPHGTEKKIDYPFLERAKDVRQRWYEWQQDGRFVTGMEIYGDDSLLAVLVMTFVREGEEWKLESIVNDI
ncbi:MAG: hypothetical protein H0Z34_16210 [Brevibacillus sp.]|nr:hypothetical protein [Brevibacillus sp.]